jgi:uncharacterized membrane protein
MSAAIAAIAAIAAMAALTSRRRSAGRPARLAAVARVAALFLLFPLTGPLSAAPAAARTAARAARTAPATDAASTAAPRDRKAPKIKKIEEVQEIDEVEEVDVQEVDVQEVDVQEVEPGMSPGAGDTASIPPPPDQQKPEPGFWDLVGRMHPAMVHFPIAWLVLLLLVDLRTLALQRAGWERLGLYVLAGTALAFATASLSGWLRAEELPRSPPTATLLEAHHLLAYSAGGVLLAALLLRLARKNRLEGPWRWLYLALLASATGLVLWAGHRGAKLVYGADFLPF